VREHERGEFAVEDFGSTDELACVFVVKSADGKKPTVYN
jgi:hypothetical protein